MAWLPAGPNLLISDSPYLAPHTLFINSATNTYQICGVVQPALPSPGVWHTIDLTPIGVPINAVAVDLRGVLIITDGANSADTSLALSFQIPGGVQSVANYEMQTCAELSTGGSRSTASVICPCVNGCIQYSWYRGNSTGEWPANPLVSAYPIGASYGFNLNVQAVYLP